MDIQEAGIEGRILNFLQNFLKSKSFKANVNEILSDTEIQTEGISKGSVVSPTFFILKINIIVVQLPNDSKFEKSPYMKDLQVSYRHSNWKIVKRKLLDSINVVKTFAQKNHFKFSTSQTSMLHFTKLSSPPPKELWLGNIRIQKSETVKNHCLVFHSKLDWKANIQLLKSKFNKPLNLFRSVSSTELAADQKRLMMIYRSWIISKVDYRCRVYNSASSMEPESLESVYN